MSYVVWIFGVVGADEEALKDFWDYCEERQREERIIAEMKIKG